MVQEGTLVQVKPHYDDKLQQDLLNIPEKQYAGRKWLHFEINPHNDRNISFVTHKNKKVVRLPQEATAARVRVEGALQFGYSQLVPDTQHTNITSTDVSTRASPTLDATTSTDVSYLLPQVRQIRLH